MLCRFLNSNFSAVARGRKNPDQNIRRNALSVPIRYGGNSGSGRPRALRDFSVGLSTGLDDLRECYGQFRAEFHLRGIRHGQAEDLPKFLRGVNRYDFTCPRFCHPKPSEAVCDRLLSRSGLSR